YPHHSITHTVDLYEPDQRVAGPEQPAERGLAEPEVGEERRLLVAPEPSDLRLDHRRHPAHARVRARRERLEVEALDHAWPLGERTLVEVHAMQDRLLGQEREAADGLGA